MWFAEFKLYGDWWENAFGQLKGFGRKKDIEEYK